MYTEQNVMTHSAVTWQRFNFEISRCNRNSAVNYTDDNAFTIQLFQDFNNILWQMFNGLMTEVNQGCLAGGLSSQSVISLLTLTSSAVTVK